MKTITVRFMEGYTPYSKGEIATFFEGEAEQLIKRGIAEEVKVKDIAEPAETKDIAEPAETRDIKVSKRK